MTIRQLVIRVDKSPLNPKQKCVELACGHEVWVSRAPRIGVQVQCDRCTQDSNETEAKLKAEIK